MNINVSGPIAQMRNGIPDSGCDMAVIKLVSDALYFSASFPIRTIWEEVYVRRF